ncbi:ribosome biogenesis GTPase YqeH [Lacticigenium naphthae]|uniref:ribosome biogenesis GTPase YqeH n=1 Tax=Lacticigenium naphthae TaxID=515351 RepID=UPI0004158CC1|nr:ribosome biogenesis GTPase YqeH [Lacticigenium naphthae]
MTQLENNEELYCIGCGAKLQSENKNASGYIPASHLNSEEDVYCQRCFRLRHYNEIQDIELTDSDFLKMLNEIGEKNALIVNLVDIFDFNGSVIPGIHRFVGNNPVILVGNKKDLLPKSLKVGKMTQWLTERAHEIGIRPIEVSLISAMKKDDVTRLMDMIEKHRKGRDVYVVGTTNVGKSTLINQIIRLSSDEQEIITTSYFPGTTLGKIEIPLDDGSFLIDTPGIIQPQQMAQFLEPKDLKAITPKKEIKPKTYQLNEAQTIFMGGLARFDYVKGDAKQPFVLYFANGIDFHRTKTERATELYENHKGELLSPPSLDNIEKLPELKRFEFTIQEKSDVVFSGLGWITVDQPNTVVAAWAPQGVDIIVRKALV